jgi:hypothetical protein
MKETLVGFMPLTMLLFSATPKNWPFQRNAAFSHSSFKKFDYFATFLGNDIEAKMTNVNATEQSLGSNNLRHLVWL